MRARVWLQVREDKAVHADGAGKGEGAAVQPADGRAAVGRAVRRRGAQGAGHTRLPGGAVLRVVHARHAEDHAGHAQRRRAVRPGRQGPKRGTSARYAPAERARDVDGK